MCAVPSGACAITSVNVPPTSPPILELSAISSMMYGRDMKSHIAEARAYSVATSLDEIGPINRESVETRVAGALRELIVSGQLPEGTPLVQRDLAQRLGVSQTPIRIGL